MTEAEWLACEDPEKLLARLGRKASKRKRRLFACACCYRVWSLIADERSRAALIAAEQFADGLIDEGELELRERAAKVADWSRRETSSIDSACQACTCVSQNRAGNAVHAWRSVVWAAEWRRAEEKGTNPNRPGFAAVTAQAKAEELAQQAALLRDIFGNPFRPLAFDPAWRTSDVLALATGIYDEKAFDRMPILADALQDAGCDNDDVLSHCRGTGPHVRGCWVVDSVLEK